MKIMRSRVVAVIVTLAMVFSVLAIPVSAAAPTATNDQAAQFLQEKNLLQGDNGNLMLDKDLTREEMMVIMSRLLGEEDVAKVYPLDEMTFTDVAADSWSAPYVAWAQANGYAQGYSAESFGPKDALTPWQTAAFLVRTLGYVDTTDADMQAKAAELGILAGSTVDASAANKAAMKRGDMALLMYNTVYAETPEGTVLGEDLGVLAPSAVLSDVKASATSTSAEKVTITGKVEPATAAVTVAGVAATVASDGTFSAEASLVVGTNNIEVAAGSAKQTVVVERVDKLAVEKVEATNLKQVVVTFNGEVDADSAEKEGNYAISGFAVSLAELAADGKTVTLLLDSAMDNNEDYTLTVDENLEAADGTKLGDDVEVDFTAKDYAIPTATIVAKGSKVIEVTFSEPVKNVMETDNTPNDTTDAYEDNLNNFKLDDSLIDVMGDGDLNHVDHAKDCTVTSNDMGTVYTFTFVDELPLGDIDFTMKKLATAYNAIVDYAGYKVAPKTVTLTIEEDTTIPNVEKVEALNQTTARVTFTKGMALNEGTADKADFFWNTTGSLTSGKQATELEKVDDMTWDVKFSSDTNAMNDGKIYFLVRDVEDFYGNMIFGNTTEDNTYKTQIEVESNEVPTVESVTADSDTEIVVAYSTDMDQDSAKKKSNYSLKDPDGDTVAISGIAYDTDTDEATLTVAAMDSGDYKLTISNVEDVIGNKVASKTYTFSATDETSVGYDSVAWVGKVAVLTFNGEVATSGDYDATNTDNYKYKNAELPGGTDIDVVGQGKQVRITLPSGTFAKNDVIKVGYFEGTKVHTIADVAGNLYSPTAVTLSDEATAKIDISAATIKVTGTDTVELTIPDSRPAFDADELSEDDFSVTVAGHAVDVTDAQLDPDDARVLTLTLDTDSDTEISAGDTVVVSTQTLPADISSKDVFGVKILENKSISTATSEIRPELVSATVLDSTHIAVAFDSAIDSSDYGELATQLVVKQVQDDENVSLTLSSPASFSTKADDKVVKFTTSGSIDLETPVTVKTVGQDFITAKALNGGILKADTTGVDASNFAVTSVTVNDRDHSAKISAGDVITLGFNRNVDFDSIEDRNWDTALTNVEASVDHDDGSFTVDGYSVGTLSGLTVPADKSDLKVSLAKVDEKTLSITVTSAGTSDVTYGTGLLEFEAASNIKSAAGTTINTDFLGTAVAADLTGPEFVSASLAANDTTLTLTFRENLANNTADATALKAAVKVATDGTTFVALAGGDTVTISTNTLVIEFASALTTTTNKVSVAASTLKDGQNKVLTTATTTATIDATAN